MSEITRPREIRAWHPGYELRTAEDGAPPTMFGHFAVFNRWAEIDSFWEGRFMERILPGSFRKTFRENRDKIRALFQHGQDPQVGDKPLGPVEELHEDDTGAYYEVPLLDTTYNRDLLPGLEAGLYGSSFRFEVMREERDEKPGVAEHNPEGLPERSIKEMRLFEFGPVTFPAYAEATADIRSLTDWFLFEQIARDPQRARSLIALGTHEFATDGEAPSTTTPREKRTSDLERRTPKFRDREEFLAWLTQS